MAYDPSAKNAKTQNCEMQQENVSFEPERRMVPEVEKFRLLHLHVWDGS
jgi:hypothetical protein